MIEKWLLNHVPTIWLGVGMVAIAVGLSLLGLVIVRRSTELAKLRLQHDVAGFIMAVIGVIFAVLLAFTVVIQWEQYSSASKNASGEATAVGNLYRDGVSFGAAGHPLTAAIDQYAQAVVEHEYPYVAKHQEEDPAIDHYLNAMWGALNKLPTSTATQGYFVQQAISDLSAAAEARRNRIDDSASVLPALLWLALLVGAGLTIGFTYFFGLESFASLATMVSMLAVSIALPLFVILALDLPFTGNVAVEPTAMNAERVEFCSYNFAHPELGGNCSLQGTASP